MLLPTLLVPAALVSLTLAVSDAKGQVRQDPAMEVKQQTERINEQRFASLMFAVGIQVDPTNRATIGQNYQAVRLQLTTSVTSAGTSDSLAQTFSASVNSSERRAGQLPRHRSIELSSQHLVVLTIDGANRLRWWSLIPDPRLLRAESPDANNRLSGRAIYQPNIEAVVEIPDDAAAAELRFYHPQWTDDRFVLTLVSSVRVNKN
jgi:hypothetical protein